jgi:hypothetical protein
MDSAPKPSTAAVLADALHGLRAAKVPKVTVPDATTSADELAELLTEARHALGLALERDGIADTDARHFLVAIAASLAVQEATTRRWEDCLSAAVVELRRGISGEDVQAVRSMIAQAAIAAMPTGEERAAFVHQIIEAVRAGMPTPPALDLKAIEKAAEAGTQRGARLRQDGEAAQAQSRRSPLAVILGNPVALLIAGAAVGVLIARVF